MTNWSAENLQNFFLNPEFLPEKKRQTCLPHHTRRLHPHSNENQLLLLFFFFTTKCSDHFFPDCHITVPFLNGSLVTLWYQAGESVHLSLLLVSPFQQDNVIMIPKSHVTGTIGAHQSVGVISSNMTKTQQSTQEKRRFRCSTTCCKVFSVAVAKQSVLQSRLRFASIQPYSGWISVRRACRTHGSSLAANRRVKTARNSPVQ